MDDDDLFDIDEDAGMPSSVDELPEKRPEEVDAEAKAEEEPITFYGSADEWVRKFLRPTYRRRITAKGQSGGERWAAAWWGNVEAMLRIEALWRMWEDARKNPAELSAWMISHLDVHMGVLLSAGGPFSTSTDENRAGEPLPYTPPPVGMFHPDHQP